MPQETGLRERKKRQTRRDIVWAATQLFEKQGYDATSVEQIAEKAEISRGTFFNYFPSKDVLLNAIAEQEVDDLRDVFTRDLSTISSPLKRLERLVELYSRDTLEYRNVTRLTMQSILSAPDCLPSAVRSFLNLVGDQLMDARAAGEIDKDVDPEEAVIAFMGIHLASVFWSIAQEDSSTSPQERFYSLLDLLFRGIAGPAYDARGN